MTEQGTSRAAQRYLAFLRGELSDLPPDRRDAVMDDVQAHIYDAVEEGRTVDDVLAKLGTPRELSAQSHEELGVGLSSIAAADRAALRLRLGAVVIAVVTAVYFAFLLPLYGSGDQAGVTLAQRFGPWASLLGLIPAVLISLTLVLPRRARRPLTLVTAVLLSLLVGIGLTIGGLYIPLAMIMWACVLVPTAIKRHFDLAASPWWRVAGGLAIAAPTLIVSARSIAAPIEFASAYWTTLAVGVAAGVLFGLGLRAIYGLIALLGFASMVVSAALPDTFFLPLWWIGGVYLAIGLSAAVVAQGRRRTEGGS